MYRDFNGISELICTPCIRLTRIDAYQSIVYWQTRGPRLKDFPTRFPTIYISAAAILIFVNLTACGVGTSREVIVVPDEDLQTPQPLVERLPVAMGIHYEQLLKHHHLETNWAGFRIEHTYRLGPPSVTLLDPHLSKMFASVVRVDSPSSKSVDGQELTGVLSLNVKSLTPLNSEPYVAARGEQARISYGMTVYAPPGVKLTSIEGSGGAKVEGISDGPTSVMARAMRKAVAALVVRFYEDPAVKAWLKTVSTGPKARRAQGAGVK